MIVVTIIAIMSGAVLTHLQGTTTDAMESVLTHNLHVYQSQIELYHVNHLGQYPKLADGGLPQLVRATNAYGDMGPPSPAFPYGPYFGVLPVNPYTQSDLVVPVAQPGKKPTGVVGKPSGWQYDVRTGAIWPNNREFYEGGAEKTGG